MFFIEGFQTVEQLSDKEEVELSNNEIYRYFFAPNLKIERTSSSKRDKSVIGSRIEVRDLIDLNKWKSATVIDVDYSNNRLKVHYDNADSRLDEWVCEADFKKKP